VVILRFGVPVVWSESDGQRLRHHDWL